MVSRMARLESLLGAVDEALVGMDRKGVIWYVNRRTELLFGYDRGGLVGLPIETVWVAAIFVAMDGCNWLAHLANHRVRTLWRFHELHHSQEDMSVLTVFRTHPLIHVSYLVALVPAIVLLANGALPTVLLVVYGAIVAFEHSNTNLGFGPLERILVSPNYHRIHHKLDGPQDVNLGFALTIWDQLFHLAVFPTPATIRTDTGLPGRPLVVEQEGPCPRHLAVFAAQLIAPFRPLHDDADQTNGETHDDKVVA